MWLLGNITVIPKPRFSKVLLMSLKNSVQGAQDRGAGQGAGPSVHWLKQWTVSPVRPLTLPQEDAWPGAGCFSIRSRKLFWGSYSFIHLFFEQIFIDCQVCDWDGGDPCYWHASVEHYLLTTHVYHLVLCSGVQLWASPTPLGILVRWDSLSDWLDTEGMAGGSRGAAGECGEKRGLPC